MAMQRKDYVRAGGAVLVVLLLAMGVCHYWPKPDPEPQPEDKGEYLLVPREMAGKFKLKDAAAIVAYCREKIRPASYEGVLRGAHGALWAGEANAWDRVLLAAEALAGKGIDARIVPGDPPRLAYRDGDAWKTVRLDGDAAVETSKALPDGAIPAIELPTKHPDRFHWLVPTFVLEAEDGKTKRVTDDPHALAAWVHEPVLLTAGDHKGSVAYALSVGALFHEPDPDRVITPQRGFATGPLRKVRRVVLELTHKFKDKATVWQRELFDARNTPKVVPGHDAARVGDRYAIVVAAGPLVPEVLQTREKMLASPKHTPLEAKVDRDLVFLGVKYQVDSDKHTGELAERTKVQVAWTPPRITIAASEPTVKHHAKPQADAPPPGLSLDALADQVEAIGKRAREFHLARGMANDVIETRVVFEVAKQPVISASTVLSRFKAQTAETPERRLTQILNEAKRILAEEPIGTKLSLTAHLPRGAQADPKPADAKPPQLVVERAPSGLVLHGVAVNEGIKKEPGKKPKVSERFRWEPSASAPFGTDAVALAVAADGMLAHQTRRPNYALKLDVLSGWPVAPLPITAGSVLRYRAQHDGKKYSVNVLVALKDGVPGGMWFTAPEGKPWVDLFPREGSRVGEVAGRWPEVLSSTAIGPAVESFLVPAGAHVKGEKTNVRVKVANQSRDVPGVKIPLPQAATFVEVKSDDRWHAAIFTRPKGLQEREGDLYRVRYLGATPTDEQPVSRDACRPLEPVEAQIDGQWRLANLLDRTGDDRIVHVCGEADAKHKLPKGRVRAVRLVEAQVDGKWRPGHLVESKDAKHHVRVLDDKSEKAEWLPAERVKTWETRAAKDAHAVVLTSGQLPLLLHWQNGDTTLTLELASPVVLGRTIDAETDLPVADVDVSRSQGKWKVRSAADGSFALHLDDPLFPLVSFVMRTPKPYMQHPSVRQPGERRVLLIVDQSTRMKLGLDPESKEEAKAGQQRLDALRREVKSFFTSILAPQDRNRVSLWTYAALPKKTPPDDPAAVTEHVDFAGDSQVHTKLGQLKPDGESALSAAMLKLGQAAAKGKLPDNLLVVLFTAGGSNGKKTAVQAYRESKCKLPIHIFGLGVKADSPADKELAALAEASGGSYRAAAAKPPFALDQGPFRARVAGLPVDVTSTCYSPARLRFAVDDVGLKPVAVRLEHECRCRHKPRQLLTITNKNVADLAKCDGLSPRAKEMIEQRVKDGAWKVTIPNQRVNIGNISAYGWFETEEATGRLVGRTEDGLHGATADEDAWPPFDPSKVGNFGKALTQLPFVVQYEGIVAYTTGSVLGAMTWHKQPGFMSGGPEEFKKFVQANALDFSATWWEEVGSASAPQFAEYYWSGVCLNFVLQSQALGLPPDGCFRRWGENLCNRARDAVAEAGPEIASDQLNELLEDRFGEEKASWIRRAMDYGFKDMADEFTQTWNEGVRLGFNCERLRGKR